MAEYTLKDYYEELREIERLERRMSRMERKVGRDLALIQEDLGDFYSHLKFVATNVHMPYRVKDAGLKYYFQMFLLLIKIGTFLLILVLFLNRFIYL